MIYCGNVGSSTFWVLQQKRPCHSKSLSTAPQMVVGCAERPLLLTSGSEESYRIRQSFFMSCTGDGQHFEVHLEMDQQPAIHD